MKRFTFLALLACTLPLAAETSTGAGSTLETLKKHWKMSKEYTLAIAEQMPASDYAFKPNKDEMSFGGQIEHIASANYFFFGAITGAKPAETPKGPLPKEQAIKLLQDSYDFGSKQLDSMTEAQLTKVIDLEGGKMTSLEGVMMALDHCTHHRAQTVVYLRVKGIKPADYRY